MAKRPDQIRPEPTNGQQIPKHRGIGEASPPDATGNLEQEERTAPHGANRLVQQFRELGEYLSYYAVAKLDGVKLSLRNSVIWIVSAALGFVAISGLIVAASCFVLSGMAEGLTLLLGGRVWAGKIVAGFLCIAGLGLAMSYMATKRKRTSRERTTEKYENRQARQQADFGHNVSNRADDADSERK